MRLCLVLLFTSMQGQGLMFHYTINLGNIHIQKKMIEKKYLTKKMYVLSINDSTGKYLKMQY